MSYNTFNKDNLDHYLKELGKEFRKLNGKTIPAEIILVGGAAILVNYGFRNMTNDIDAVIHASSTMKDAINRIADKFELPNGWLNADFVHTGSYSTKLLQFCDYYRSFSNVLTVRTVSAEYLIAMKLKAGRKFKHDLSDIVGILAEHEKRGEPITIEAVKTAVINLYGSWDSITADIRDFIENTFQKGEYEKLFTEITKQEENAKEIMLEFEAGYPGAATQNNANDILEALKQRRKPNLDERIKECKNQQKIPADGLKKDKLNEKER